MYTLLRLICEWYVRGMTIGRKKKGQERKLDSPLPGLESAEDKKIN